jgi:hypothetical protein
MVRLLVSGIKKSLGLLDSTQWEYAKLGYAIRRYQRAHDPSDEPDSCFMAFVVRLEAIVRDKTLSESDRLLLARHEFDQLKAWRSNELSGGIQVLYDR